jgi:hypothetical protein
LPAKPTAQVATIIAAAWAKARGMAVSSLMIAACYKFVNYGSEMVLAVIDNGMVSAEPSPSP